MRLPTKETVIHISSFIFMIVMIVLNLTYASVNAYRFNATTQSRLFIMTQLQAFFTALLTISFLTALLLLTEE